MIPRQTSLCWFLNHLTPKRPRKSTAPSVVLESLRSCTSWGGNRAEIESYGVYSAASLEDAAAIAVALELKQPLPSRDFQARIETEYLELAKEEASMLSGSQKYLRGLFCGGTHSEEAVLLLKNMVSDLHSNISFGGAKLLEDPKKSIGNSLVDMGDEVFTRGKPHPVIEPLCYDRQNH